MSDRVQALRRRTGSTLIALLGFALVASAGAKFAQVPTVVGELRLMGFDGSRLTFIAVLELISALLFLTPRTRAAGLLLVSSFLGGAVATHLQHGQSIAPPSLVLSLVWLGSWLRHPGLLWSFRRPAEIAEANSPMLIVPPHARSRPQP